MKSETTRRIEQELGYNVQEFESAEDYIVTHNQKVVMAGLVCIILVSAIFNLIQATKLYSDKLANKS